MKNVHPVVLPVVLVILITFKIVFMGAGFLTWSTFVLGLICIAIGISKARDENRKKEAEEVLQIGEKL
ncbi:hypothetical protein [Olivibacter domesticus]|uniref:hypothetical protein n=1 Tax=Olivibacter domesticus TaxID=407022 RepID=UPI0011133178|nr:hypothetical protein [Olivibacter domesticus]